MCLGCVLKVLLRDIQPEIQVPSPPPRQLLIILNISQHVEYYYFSMNFFLKLYRVSQYFVAID